MSSQPFRFLDLPGEIRNNIYDLVLCSWEDELEQDASMISSLSCRRLSNPSTALLRANRQINAEASDYMIKRNQFVRITCRGLDVRNLFLSEGIPVITTDARKISLFDGHVMHITLSKPALVPVPVPAPFQFSESEMMMLRSDLPKLCEQLDIESVMSDVNSTIGEHASIQASIRLDYHQTRFLAPKMQKRLLQPIATALRGVSKLKITGPVDTAVGVAIREEVAQPRWIQPDATIEEIGTGVDVGKRQWQQNNIYAASESWAYAMRTLERMRHSSSWIGLQNAGGEDFVNKTADLYFTLHLLHAQFLQVDMADEGPLVQRNGRVALVHLRRCETASARFAQHAGATWTPSQEQSAKMLFRHARCLRLLRDPATRVKAITLIEEAAALAPTDVAIRDEKDAVVAWETELQETRNDQARVQAEGNEGWWVSVWGALLSAVTELTS